MRRLALPFAMLMALAAGCGGYADGPVTSTAPGPSATPGTARYRVVFDSTWTAITHPQEAPPNPHFSTPIGATHNASVTFWRDGALASEGIRRMAEQGSTSPLDNEIRAAIAAGTAQHLFLGEGFSSPRLISLEFDVSSAHPLVTLVSMVAPSPDWFAGVAGLALFENGAWIETRVIDVYPWDAGTDSGRTFLSPDLETIPRQPISRIATAPFAVSGAVAPLGTLRFTRIG
jgi:hypothetical protein